MVMRGTGRNTLAAPGGLHGHAFLSSMCLSRRFVYSKRTGRRRDPRGRVMDD